MDPATLLLDREKLLALADEERAAYAAAQPFPHAVFDDVFDAAVLERVLEEFPAPSEVEWERFDDAMQKKLANRRQEQMGAVTRLFLSQLNAAAFVEFLERLTGIEGLVPDPHLDGGGLHQIQRGGLLKVHVDFERHSHLDLDRRLNVLLYLNREWEESHGGHLELWDPEMTRCERRVLPTFNRMVVFSTTASSYHGHPDPLTCPEGASRKSLALYYYSNGRPAHERSSSAARSTVFKRRPGERIGPSLHEAVQLFVPPVLSSALEKLGRRR